MSEPTLAELKAAMDNLLPAPGPFSSKDASAIYVAERMMEYQARRADAWRTAFKWHVGLVDRYAKFDDQGHITDALTLDRECNEGMRLIREHLR